VRNDREDRILVAIDFEIKSPIPIHPRLPKIFGSIELLGTERWMTEIRQQVIELLGKRLTDVGRKPTVVLIGPLRKANPHLRFGFAFTARDSNAAIASFADE
jgi:hypothetical protein